MTRWGLALMVLAAIVATPPSAAAQGSAAESDTTVAYFTRGPGFLSRLHVAPWLDARLRHDALKDRPGAPDFARVRATLRAGLAWERPSQPVRIEAGLRASLGSDHNRETWSPFDNEVADTLEVDRLGVRLANAAGDHVAIGKMRLPVPLTEMLWDDELRPVGIGFHTRLAWTGLEGLSAGGGAFQRSRFEGDDVRFGVAQLALVRGNPATFGGDVRASYLPFFQLEHVVSQGRTRQNAVRVTPVGTRLVEHFRVLDVQLAGHAHAGAWRVTARVDGAHNAAALRDAWAIRTRLAVGGTGAPAGIEAGWVYQRIEREAVLGALNSDDWWFHSRSRGHSLFLHAGLGRPVSLRIAAFHENRDDVRVATQRLVSELRWNWGE